MSKIYRVRPANEKTVEEIKEHYLWFSRPSAFKDTNDANVFAFIKENESINSAFTRLFKDNVDVAEESAIAGICCFTEDMPSPATLGKFPNAKNGLVMEFDRNILEEHFVKNYGLGDCFKKVEYLNDPTLFKSTNEYDILWEKTEDGEIYKTINEISLSEKCMDQLFLKMFTRIGEQFSKQNESRVILAGRNTPDRSKDVAGYKIEFPKEAIKAVYIHENAQQSIVEAIGKLGHNIIIVSSSKKEKDQNK
ncbi:hypothetical protein [Mucilaginibacter defluvii]|uniref:Uncharacterized protein n=1 Tax=Mucilaginibacter defluvii TaxID=1196019 RepID=A0ABP9G0Z0_9SPHI